MRTSTENVILNFLIIPWETFQDTIQKLRVTFSQLGFRRNNSY